jgi:hypothetical protein
MARRRLLLAFAGHVTLLAMAIYQAQDGNIPFEDIKATRAKVFVATGDPWMNSR